MAFICEREREREEFCAHTECGRARDAHISIYAWEQLNASYRDHLVCDEMYGIWLVYTIFFVLHCFFLLLKRHTDLCSLELRFMCAWVLMMHEEKNLIKHFNVYPNQNIRLLTNIVQLHVYFIKFEKVFIYTMRNQLPHTHNNVELRF